MASSKGLAGVVAGDTSISTVGKSGVGLTYRGFSIDDLASHSTFEEVAYILIYGRLPSKIELSNYIDTLQSMRSIPSSLQIVLQQIPSSAHPMDVLRTGCSFLGTIEPETDANDSVFISNRLLACLPSMLLTWYHHHKGNVFTTNIDEASTAGFFLHGLHGREPDDIYKRALDVSLILYAEHEFNASTFASRITTATLSDIYSAITSAIGTLRGTLHGGANEAALSLIKEYSSPVDAVSGVVAKLNSKALIMGFGHRVYSSCDPRSDIVKLWAKKLTIAKNKKELYRIANSIEKTMWNQKKLFPNLDFYSSIVYDMCDIPQSFFTPLFVMARTAGWASHVMEQRSNNKLIRPDANYIGPDETPYVTMEDRCGE